MTPALRGATADIFDALTDRSYLVIDTEYTPAPDGTVRIISVAVVPVVRGVRTRGDELYVEMNPQVPITAGSAAVHGFTDERVRGKRPFAFYAQRILDALDAPDAVLVQHSRVDVAALHSELQRTGAGDLPDLPVLDTSTLPRSLRLPNASSAVVSLGTLCALTGVTNRGPHHAREDARATADAFVALLRHAATHATHTNSTQLLSELARSSTDVATLSAPRAPRTRTRTAATLPEAHLRRHAEPLTHAASSAELAAWLEMAAECATLRCPHLEPEADMAAEANGPAVLAGLEELLAQPAEPGQQGTLAGAMLRLLEPTSGTPALRVAGPMYWWRRVRALLAQGKPCTPDAGQCPHCHRGDPCPRDVMKYAFARIATADAEGQLTDKRIRSVLFGPQPKRYINAWPRRNPDIAALMVDLVIDYEMSKGARALAHSRLRLAMDKQLHLAEPVLAVRACEALWAAGEPDTADSIATHVLAQSTSDPAYTALRARLALHDAAVVSRARAARNIRFPQLARPAGRVNANPYALE